MMKRFSALLMIMVALLLFTLSGGTPVAKASSFPTPEKPITMRMGYDAPVGEITDLAANEFKRIVEAETNGAIRIQVFPQNQLGSMRAMFDGVLSGTIDMVASPWNMLTTVMPEFNAMILPFNISIPDHYWAVLGDDEFRNRINAVVNEKGLEYLGTPNGVFRGLISKNPIKVPAELRGVKIRVMDGPIYTDMFRAWGATTVVISFPEVYTAFQQGVIDGMDNDPTIGVMMKFFEVAKNFTPTNHIIHGCPLVLNGAVWNRLSPEQQAIMKSAGKRMEKFAAENDPPISAAFHEKARTEFGVNFVEFGEPDRQAWFDASKPVYEKYRGIIGAEFFDWFMKFVEAKRPK